MPMHTKCILHNTKDATHRRYSTPKKYCNQGVKICPKMPRNGPKMASKAQFNIPTQDQNKKKCSLLSSTFDEWPFQRYMPKTKFWPRNGPNMTQKLHFEIGGYLPKTEIEKKCSPLSPIFWLMFIWENGTLFSQLFMLMAGTWLGAVNVSKIRIFDQKVNFFQWDPFFQKAIGGHWHKLHIGVGPIPKSFFVSDLGNFYHFLQKSLTQPHYGVLSVSNKPALTAHRPYGPARCARAGLDH